MSPATPPRRILIVDDDHKTLQLLRTYLEKQQYEVLLAQDGASFLATFKREADSLSLVILDVMLPDTDGFSLCRQVRECSQLGIIMLTASSDEMDRVIGLEMGADDYIAKPYSPRELLARIKAILRRSGAEPGGERPPRSYSFAGFTLDVVARQLRDAAGTPLPLTGLDFQLLRYFVEHPGRLVDRQVLAEQAHGRAVDPADRSLDVQISRLRLRLGDTGKQAQLIKTVRGAGYVFAAEVVARHG